MKILIVSQYFWPENFRVNDLAVQLQLRGHQVTVLTGVPNYPLGKVDPQYRSDPSAFSTLAGVEILRIPMVPRGSSRISLALNYFSFVISGCSFGVSRIWGRRFDAIFVWQVSPITAALPAIVFKRIVRAPLALWVLDLWPDTLKAVGATTNRFVLGAVGKLASFIYRHCNIVFGQSQTIAREIAQRVGEATRVAYLPSWAEPSEPPQAPAAELAADMRFTVLFAGNMGEAQDFPSILDAAELLRTAPVRWVIVGDGRKADWVRSEVVRRQLSDSVVLAGRYPSERMPSFFAHADALLVTLRADPVLAMTVPGKVQTYLNAGRPILAMLDGEGGDVISQSGAGIAVPSGDPSGLAAAIMQLCALSQSELQQMGERGRQYCARYFDRGAVISGLEQMLKQLADGQSPIATPRR